ncbi:hypothetical protein ATCC90586_012070 [Pythium insidiosum]|nr:hypothetical protein ATCC90586_012070 [Pythium insidiosum]
MAELLKVKYPFNFHLNLIIALVPMTESQFPTRRSARLHIVVVRQKKHRVKGDIIRTFLKMPLEVTMEQGETSREKAKSDRKKRR